MPLRTTLETHQRMSGKTPPELDNPVEMPPQLAHIWQWFLVLHQGRSDRDPLSESDIGWFFWNRGIRPQGWEPDVIRVLDRAALEGLYGAE